MLFCMLEVVEGDRCLPELLEVVRFVLEIMLCVFKCWGLCMLEDDALCTTGAEVPEVMLCML